MKNRNLSSPFTALAEKDATGKIANLFADIRGTMEIPLITSVWRILVDVEGGLEHTWAAAKQLYNTGQPQASLLKTTREARFPVPDPISLEVLADAGVLEKDLNTVLAILRAYNRSNGLNFIVLHALLESPRGEPADKVTPPSPNPWPSLPDLPEKSDIGEATWTCLEQFQDLTVLPKDGSIPTVLRHLSYWPGLLDLVYTSMSPLLVDGSIASSMQQVLSMAKVEGARIAYLRPALDAIPDEAMVFLKDYAHHVHQIITICNGVDFWLEAARQGDNFKQ